MNQIIFTNKTSKNKKVKLFICIYLIALFYIFMLIRYYLDANIYNSFEECINQSRDLVKIYENENESENKKSIYLCEIYIEKINVNYKVFNNFSDELLKILPCKFYGGELGDNTNICIAGHNFNTDKFFSRLDELEIGDYIYLKNLFDGNVYSYKVYDIYEINSDDLSILKQNINYELTLLTCDNLNNKRLIIKSYLNNNIEKKE